MTNDIFNEQGSTEPKEAVTSSDTSTPPVSNDVFADQLSMIKNDNGEVKYETVPKALDALANAQAHIPKLEIENQELRQKLEGMQEHLSKVDKLEDIVTRLSSNADAAEPQQGTQTVENIEEKVNQVLNQRQASDIRVSNINEVSVQMQSLYGDKVQHKLIEKATELGVDVNYLQQTAATSPKMFMAMFGGEVKKSTVTPMTNSVQTPAIVPTTYVRPQSLMAGATTKDLLHEMASLKEEAIKKYGL